MTTEQTCSFPIMVKMAPWMPGHKAWCVVENKVRELKIKRITIELLKPNTEDINAPLYEATVQLYLQINDAGDIAKLDATACYFTKQALLESL